MIPERTITCSTSGVTHELDVQLPQLPFVLLALQFSGAGGTGVARVLPVLS
jgi:hypothetical protein